MGVNGNSRMELWKWVQAQRGRTEGEKDGDREQRKGGGRERGDRWEDKFMDLGQVADSEMLTNKGRWEWRGNTWST